jgi:hypothetical protein
MVASVLSRLGPSVSQMGPNASRAAAPSYQQHALQVLTSEQLMRNLTAWMGGLGFLLAAGCGGDTVKATGGDGAEDGLLVDGNVSATVHNDDRTTGADGAAIPVGPYDGGAGEVIAYTVGHAPTVKPSVGWSSGNDAVSIGFDPKYKVKFQNWIVQGPFATGQTRAVNACIRTSQIWRDERQGTSFSAFDITDATANAKASSYTAFTCSLASGIKTDIGFDASAVNVYWVNTVDFGSGAATSNGVWCGGNMVAMGASVLDHLFSHEIGHAYALEHVNSLTSFFDQTNVMHNASNFRAFLAEGQTFRAATTGGSVVNTLGGRSGVTRPCGGTATTTTDAQCPAVQKRVWADGASWPPN